MTARFDAHAHAYEEQTRTSGIIYLLLLAVALAFGGFLWQLYSDTDVPRIAAAPGPYKVEASSASVADSGEQSAAPTARTTQPPPQVETAEEAAGTNASPASAGGVSFSPSGPYVAQLAALQSEAAVEQAWRRFSSRAPTLFAAARLDMERADLGARGVYYRVRAGYFADRAAAARFCDRIREFGQDCIPATR